jgi:hypothetical protein
MSNDDLFGGFTDSDEEKSESEVSEVEKGKRTIFCLLYEGRFIGGQDLERKMIKTRG